MAKGFQSYAPFPKFFYIHISISRGNSGYAHLNQW